MLLPIVATTSFILICIYVDLGLPKLRRLTNLHLHLVWRLRSVLHCHPLPRQLAGWQPTPLSYDDQDQFAREMFEIQSYWLYLDTFFHLKGYRIFKPVDGNFHERKWLNLVPGPHEESKRSKGRRRSDYPYARKGYPDDYPMQFFFSSPRVWPARDVDGNDLIIRLVSDDQCSDELRIWRRLHSPGVKNHPRNRAIPVLEYLEFDGLTFIVMPRWDSPSSNDYATAEEVLNMAECIFDAVDFLHEHRIVHRDLEFQNVGLNVVIGKQRYPKGNHDPKEAMYAIIDFGFSLIYPYETHLEEATTTLRYGCEFEDENPPRNPFTLETYYAAKMIQHSARIVEKFIPEIGPFFDDILNAEEANRPFAREVLQRFRQLKSSLTTDQLKMPLEDRYWTDAVNFLREILSQVYN
ncbi:hypothetical protein CVT24_012888 [Panaeolus cyanescens]|uniref:Protein kinase domain-containing protein n=1 Tax=Panaeolus cyanescens TaxID=181874 RepID=A0A409WKX4_9AGAR|nr:hypothetical protein CVT24_012888 [Panaeolus cyanescens]